jgi:hypothetical protein
MYISHDDFIPNLERLYKYTEEARRGRGGGGGRGVEDRDNCSRDSWVLPSPVSYTSLHILLSKLDPSGPNGPVVLGRRGKSVLSEGSTSLG